MMDESNETALMEAENTTRTYTITTFVGSLTMIILCVMGLYTNVISWVIFISKSMRSSINILLGALSLIDFMVILLAVPVFVLPGLDEYVNFNFVNKYYSFVILYLYPFAMISQTSSIWTFVLISIERYYAVCFPLEANRRLTIGTGRAKISQLLVIIFSVLYNLVRFWEYMPNPLLYDRSADQVIPFLRSNRNYFLFYYIISYLIIHFFVPFLLILSLNAKIFLAIRRATYERKLMDVNGNRNFRYGKTRMVIVVTVIFLLCNFFTFILNIWEACQPNLFQSSRHVTWAFLLLDLSNIGVILNSSTNFIVYLIYCSKYRRLFLLYFQCNCRSVPEGQNFAQLSDYYSWRRNNHHHNHANKFVTKSLKNCKRAYSIV